MSDYIVLHDHGSMRAGSLVHEDRVAELAADRVPLLLLAPGELAHFEETFRRADAAARGPALVAAWLGASLPAGGSIYVVPEGDDRASGLRPTAPMRTLAAALRRVDRALACGVDGDVVVELAPSFLSYLVEAPIHLRAPPHGRRVILRGHPLGAALEARSALSIDRWGLTVADEPWEPGEHKGLAVVLPDGSERVVVDNGTSGLAFAEPLEEAPAPGTIHLHQLYAQIELAYADPEHPALGPWFVTGGGERHLSLERVAVVLP